MEHGIIKTQLSSRSLVIALISAGAVTGVNLWIHRGDPAIGYRRYENFGVSFDYDIWTNVREADFGGGPPLESGGSVTAYYQSEEVLKQFGVFWAEPEIIPSHYSDSLEGVIEFLHGIAGMAGTQILDKGEYSTTTKDGYQVLYQTFCIAEDGIKIPAVIGAWYSEGQGRFLYLYLVHVPDFENIEAPNEELVEMWADTLGSIKFVEIQD